MKHTFKYLTLLLLFTAALSSCEREDPNDQGNEGRLAEATLTFRVPGSNLPGTRALKEDNHDRDIKEVTVLEFRDGKYLHSRTGTILQYPNSSGSDETKNQIKFKITLATGTCDLVILANANSIISAAYPTGIPAETTKAAIAAALEMTLGNTTGESDKWNTNTSTTTYHIPMWGELVSAVIPETGDITYDESKKQNLTRMVAKVDVTIDNIKVPTSNFTLTEVHFFNYQRKGMLIPDITKYTAKTPTLPATQLGLTGSDRGQKWGDGDTAIPDNKLTGEIFTFAAPAGTDYRSQPCVIVGGKYKGSSKNTYYRIDFIDTNGDHLPLLRNYKYDIVVTKVSGEGYVNVPTAYSSRPMNLESQVMQWNESDMNDVVFDGVNFMSVSPGEFEISQLGVTTADNHIITVATDVDVIDSKNWTATVYHDEAGNNEMTADNDQWLRLDKYSDNKVYDPSDPSTKSQVVLTADPSTDPDARYAWIHFKAGRLVYVVKVTQLNYEPAYVWITDENGNSISSLTFSSENPVPKKFRVTWSPKSQPLQIERMPGADPFVYTDADDTSNWPEIRVEDAVDGIYEFTIDPTKYTEAQLKENPFKATSMIMRFITSDAMNNRKEAEINLRQMDYKIILEDFKDGYVGYLVEAGVKANARWTMEVIDGSDKLSSSVTPPATGSASTQKAIPFKYQYRDIGNRGEVTFRFSSPEGLFADQEVTVNLIPISGLFARSNVVFMGGKLTFAIDEGDNDDIPANSQGVYFFRGSLLAISPSNASNVSLTDIVYNPSTVTIGEIAADATKFPWCREIWGSDLGKVDSYIKQFPKDYISAVNYRGGYDPDAGKGDICRYISDQGWVEGYWRMPTTYEYRQVLIPETTSSQLGGIKYGNFAGESNTSSGGLYPIQSGRLAGIGINPLTDFDGDSNMQSPGEDRVFFPASGELNNYQNTSIANYGISGRYWPSSVAYSGNNFIEQWNTLTVYDEAISSSTSSGFSAFSVRCIRDGILNSK